MAAAKKKTAKKKVAKKKKPVKVFDSAEVYKKTNVYETGRPSKYTEELADEICARISNGEPLVRIVRDDHMPNTVTVYKWLRIYPEFLNRYEISRLEQADTYADQIADIADESSTSTPMEVQKSRLRIDARKWCAAKLKPVKYGERIQVGVDNIDKLIEMELKKLNGGS